MKKSKRKKSLLIVAKSIRRGVDGLLARRPHRSFRKTDRRDYKRNLKLPGYWAFSCYVLGVIGAYKKPLLIMTGFYALFVFLFFGLGSQEEFTALQNSIKDASNAAVGGGWSEVGQAALLAVTTVAGSLSPALSESQQLYAAVVGLMMWLTVVAFLRQSLAGNKVKVRDALYNAGSPIVPVAMLAVLLVIQLIPVALAMIGFGAAQSSGLLQGGIEAMLFWLAAGCLALLSSYWGMGTIFAMIIATKPGVYPMTALRLAGDMVSSRRLRLLMRLLWSAFLVFLVWVIVMVPLIMMDGGLKAWAPSLSWLPIIPVAVIILSSVSLLWFIVYVYLLYREVLKDETEPA